MVESTQTGTIVDNHRGKIGSLFVSIILNDICQEQVDAITNAANGRLSHGGGVAGAISRNGGQSIWQESKAWIKKNGQVPIGNCAVTGAGKLRAKYIIHTVGPIWSQQKGRKWNVDMLYNAVYNTLKTAEELKCESVSIPAISSGIFGFPKPLCAEVFFKAIFAFSIKESKHLKEIRLCNFDTETTNIFKEEFIKWFYPAQDNTTSEKSQEVHNDAVQKDEEMKSAEKSKPAQVIVENPEAEAPPDNLSQDISKLAIIDKPSISKSKRPFETMKTKQTSLDSFLIKN